jgi:hypothetical protein
MPRRLLPGISKALRAGATRAGITSRVLDGVEGDGLAAAIAIFAIVLSELCVGFAVVGSAPGAGVADELLGPDDSVEPGALISAVISTLSTLTVATLESRRQASSINRC